MRTILFLAATLLVGMGAAAFAQTSSDGTADDGVFGLTRLHRFTITIAAHDYRKMDPPPTTGFLGGQSSIPGPHAGAGNMGYEFEYVPADVQADDQTFARVGLRYKGSGTYLASQFRAKRSFKIDFDRNDDRLRFHGLAKLNLNSGVMDSTKVREALAYEVFRAAGVPAPRTAFAEVVLHVPGRFNGEYLGLYTVVEQVDEAFLAAHFQNGDGLLLKPEGIRGLPHFGEKPADYEKAYNPKSKPGRGDWSRLVELTRLVNDAEENEFRDSIAEYLDLDAFARFLAANAMLASLDGFLGLGHNYYLYLSPVTGKFTFIPWDLDLGFGGFSMYGTPEQTVELSIEHPYLGENKLIERLLAMPDFKAAYREHVRRLADEVFTPEQLGADLAAARELAKGPIAKEAAGVRARGESTSAGLFPGITDSLPVDEFIVRRAESAAAQLAGTKDGHVPRMRGWFGASSPRRK
jgi:spore coat protein H